MSAARARKRVAVSVSSSAPAAVTARAAHAGDVDAIVALIGSWSSAGLTLARSHDEVRGLIEAFVVAEDRAGRVVACCALERCGRGIGEIRSVSVASGMTGAGAGRSVVEAAVSRAGDRGLREIYLLTKTRGFFERAGFAVVAESVVPGWWVRERVIAAGRTLEGRWVMRRAVVRP